MGVSIWDVLAASKTKWNFLPFEPGLVGGHCIGVADPEELASEYGLQLAGLEGQYDLVIAAVGHESYRHFTAQQIERLVAEGGTIADIKGIWRDLELASAIDRWSL